MAQLQQQLLDSAMQHVKRLGWTRSSLAAAAADLQLSPAVVGMFPRGPSQLVEHFIAQQNAELDRELQAAQQQYLALPLRQRITAAVRRRLELNMQHMDSWPQVGVLQLMQNALPHNTLHPSWCILGGHHTNCGAPTLAASPSGRRGGQPVPLHAP